MPDLLLLLLLAAVAMLASTTAAVAGFGGAVILLPVLIAIFGPLEAIPILTVAQLIGNLSRVVINRRDVVPQVVLWFSLGAIPLAILGGFLFSVTPLPVLVRLLGAFLIFMAIWRHLRPSAMRIPLRGFAVLGAVASFISALVGSVGPFMAPFFLAYGLFKGAYIGTEALATVVMHVFKLVAYGGAALLTPTGIMVGLAVGPIMILGSYVGKRILDRMPERVFAWIIEGVLIFAGVTFLVGGGG